MGIYHFRGLRMEKERIELLKKNIEKFGTIFNTVQKACSISGSIEKKEGYVWLDTENGGLDSLWFTQSGTGTTSYRSIKFFHLR